MTAVKPSKRFKYWIAELFNRSPRWCWANLVMWVEYGKPLRECRIDSTCVRNLPEDGRCYCRKLNDSKVQP